MIKKQIELIDEDYIVSLTNKGMFKRALKAMEKEEVKKLLDLEFEIGEEKIRLKERLEDFECSCQADGYCKHIVMVYIYLMNNKEKNGETKTLQLEDFKAINEIGLKDVKKYANQKMINDAIIEYEKLDISHELGSVLKVDLGNKKTIDITYPIDLQDLFKRNKEKDILFAIKYIQNLSNIDNLKVEFKITDKRSLEETQKYFENLLELGLYSIKQGEIDKIEFLSISLKLNKYNFLFKKMQNLKATIQKYLSDDIDYKLEDINNQIIDILLNIYTLLGDASDYHKYKTLKKTENKFEITEISGYGIGYEIVNLKDETKLINMIILNKSDKEIYTITNLRKAKNIRSMLLFIDNTQSAKSIQDKNIILKNIIMKDENKISNSSSLKLLFDEEKDFDIKDYEVSIDQAINRFLEEEQRYFILSDRIDAFYDFGFKEEIQRFEISIRNIVGYFKYEGKEDDKIIRYLNEVDQIDNILVKLIKNEFHIEAKLIAIWIKGNKIILREN